MKRRAFDSVDPTFDNAVPSKGEGKENFFQVFAPVFDRNARWSSKKHVPKLGTMESSFEDVDNFYSFWWVVFKRRWFDYRKMLCQNTTQGSVLPFVPFFKKKKKKLLKVQLWFMEGILILGWRGKGKGWMVSSRVCVCVTAAGSIETQIRRQVHCDWIIPLTCFYFPSQSRREEMDWEAESSFQSSEEEGGDEQNTNTSR